MEAVNVISVRQTRPGPLRRSADGLVDYLVCRPSLGVHRSDARLEKRETLVPAHGSRKPLSARLPRASGVTQASAVDVLADTVPPGGSSPYDAEYRAAIEAVRLASVLCQVCLTAEAYAPTSSSNPIPAFDQSCCPAHTSLSDPLTTHHHFPYAGGAIPAEKCGESGKG